jgi:hypothetical protein
MQSIMDNLETQGDTPRFALPLFPGLFWGQPIDSAGGLAVFVNKINNLATQSWKKKFCPLLHRK